MSQQDPGEVFRALPAIWRVPTASHRTRLIAAGVLLGSVGLWLGALALQPDPRGLGTHEQLGFAPCGMLLHFGIPCPTCGITTAMAHASRLEWAAAFWAQPAGTLLGVAVYAAGGLGLWVLLTGRGWQINWYRVRPGLVALMVVGVLALGWGFKIITYLCFSVPEGAVS